MAKDLLTEVKGLTADLDKLDAEYKTSRKAIIAKLTAFGRR